MKDSLLVDSSLPIKYWAEAMDTANYIWKRLPIISQTGELIPEKEWINKKQDLNYIKIFGSVINILIPKKKRYKFNILKN